MAVPIKILFAALLVLAVWGRQCNITFANYLSPHSLGKQDEMTDALVNICKQVRINTTKYGFGSANYTIYNVTTKCIYNDGKQQADILSGDKITMYGGFIEFQLWFNFSVSRMGPDKLGYAYASVISSILNFTKEITLDQKSHPLWILAQAKPLEIPQAISIKRVDPKPTDDDLSALNQALSTAISSITPKNVKQQILDLFNENYTALLNQTLQERVMSNKVVYEYHHPYKQMLNVNVTNELYYYNITPQNGFELYYMSLPEGWNETDCTVDVPESHQDFSIFGGIQTTIGLDFLRHMALKNIRSGWFDTILTREWETNAFQFFMGDLYDIIPETQKLAPRTSLTGACNATEDSLFYVKRYKDNIFQLNLDFNCYIQTNDTARTRLAEFGVATNFRVKVIPQYETLELVIDEVIGLPTFKPVGSYVITDLKLAEFKLNMALRSLVGYRVFGSGYPVWPRDLPSVWIKDDYILLYDSSHIPHRTQVE